jgi:hypothetical protein
LIQLILIARAEATFHGGGVLHDKIQNGTLFLPAALRIGDAFAGRTRAEKAFKNLARICLGRHRRVGRTPREIVKIRARIARIANAAAATRVARQFQRRKLRQVSDLSGDGLVNGNSVVNVRRAFFQTHAGQK